MKIQKKYHSMGHKVMLVKVEKDRRGLGISLAGHRDRNRMAVFVCGLNPKGAAHKTGEISVGDEILEVCSFIFIYGSTANCQRNLRIEPAISWHRLVNGPTSVPSTYFQPSSSVHTVHMSDKSRKDKSVNF